MFQGLPLDKIMFWKKRSSALTCIAYWENSFKNFTEESIFFLLFIKDSHHIKTLPKVFIIWTESDQLFVWVISIW